MDNPIRAFGTALVRGAQDVGKAGKEFLDKTVDELSDVGEKLQEGDVIGAALEASEVVTPGSHVANALGALGILPDDPLAQNLVSASANLAAGALGMNPLAVVAGLKDLNDASMALSGKGKSAEPARAHYCPPPGAHFAKLRAKLDAGVKLPGWPLIVKRPPLIRPGCGLDAIVRAWPQMTISVNINVQVNQAIRGALDQAGVVQNGPPCRDKPMGERTVQDILNDPTLCFEDMVAMVMAKVCDEMQKEVEEQIKKLDSMVNKKGAGDAKPTESKKTEGKKTEGAKGKDGAKEAREGGKAEAAGGKGSQDPAMFALDVLIFGPVGTLIGRGLLGGESPSKSIMDAISKAVGGPEGLGQLLQGAKALAPVLAPLVSGALMAAPPIGPLLAPFAPLLVNMALDAATGVCAEAVKGQGKGAQAAAGGVGGAEKPNPQLTNPANQGKGSETHIGDTKNGDKDSINIEMEKLKLLMQRMQQMQQCLSNILNTMHQGAMNAIRNIR